MSKKILPIGLFFAVLMCFSPVKAQEPSPAFKSTPYPVPRYVSLGSDEVYVRAGPGKRYPIQWVLNKEGIPVEIILEYEAWRKIKDHEGETGWVHGSLLSGRRTAFVQSDANVNVHQKPKASSRTKAVVQPGALLNVEKCNGAWCEIEASGYGGWVLQENLWGVYPAEQFD